MVRQILEQISALAAENHGFEEARIILRDEFDLRRSEKERSPEDNEELFGK